MTTRTWIAGLAAAMLLMLFYPVSLAAEATQDAHDLMRQGSAAYRQGEFGPALTKWKEAAELYRQAGQVVGEIEARSNAAHAALAAGHVQQALQQQEAAMDLAQRINDPIWLARTVSQLGKIYAGSRQYEAALEYLRQAADLAKTHNLPQLSPAVLNDVGAVNASQGHWPEAMAAFQESAQLAQAEDLRLLFARARINTARVAIQLAQQTEAAQALDDAGRVLSEIPVSHEAADGLINLALAYRNLSLAQPDMKERFLKLSAASLQEAAAKAEGLADPRLTSYAYGYLGQLYESERRYDEALQLTRKAVFNAQSAGAAESLYRWQWQSGRLLARQGKLDEALSAYHDAVATVQPIRAEVTSAMQASPTPDQQSIRPLFFEMADLLLQRAALMDNEAEAIPYLEAAREAIEAYKAAELRDYFRDDCVDQLQARLTKLERVSASTVIIYPIIFSDRTELLVSFPQGLRRFSVPVPATVLTKEIRALRRMLEKRTTREYLPHARQLYDWLIRPIDESLRAIQIDTLVFVPDGPLRTVPMSALHDGDRFLIARYAVATSPGLDLTDPQPIDRARVLVLSGGLTKAVQGFPPLPFVAEELNYIHSVFRGDLLVDKEFVTPRLEGELNDGRYGILHIATHGEFATEVNQSFLLTFDDKLTMSELEQLVGLLRFRKDPLELLTLSACQTGIGDDRAALGLAGIAVKAGARSALATLWFINDEASFELVSEFYHQLHDPAVSKARALQLAQLKLLADRVYEHPAYWAAFLLLNNWL